MSAQNTAILNQVFALCRPGFENDCANELMFHASKHHFHAYVKTRVNTGYIQLIISNANDTGTSAFDFINTVKFNQLIFVRQWFASNSEIIILPEQDRITAINHIVSSLTHNFNAIELSYADTNEGKSLSKFTKQFRPHLERHFKNNLNKKSEHTLAIFFIDSTHVFIGIASRYNSAINPMGIPRLRMPTSAPSRSTLKLDEAFNTFLSTEQQNTLLKPGMRAVDLGAAPGGWTWQLVQRHLFVTAIDNGAMDSALMKTEMVEHLTTDAFSYSQKKVDWLVCDMVEQPHRVSILIAKWFAKRWCKHAIFNLKLPMNKRYEAVEQCKKTLYKTLDSTGLKHSLQIKHLYHDREEVTVCILTHTS